MFGQTLASGNVPFRDMGWIAIRMEEMKRGSLWGVLEEISLGDEVNLVGRVNGWILL